MTLLCFAQLLGGHSLALLSCWGDAPSHCSVAGETLPRFTQSLPFNSSIKLLQNLHSRGSMKQHFLCLGASLWVPPKGENGQWSHKYAFQRVNIAISPKSSEKCAGTPMFYATQVNEVKSKLSRQVREIRSNGFSKKDHCSQVITSQCKLE